MRPVSRHCMQDTLVDSRQVVVLELRVKSELNNWLVKLRSLGFKWNGVWSYEVWWSNRGPDPIADVYGCFGKVGFVWISQSYEDGVTLILKWLFDVDNKTREWLPIGFTASGDRQSWDFFYLLFHNASSSSRKTLRQYNLNPQLFLAEFKSSCTAWC